MAGFFESLGNAVGVPDPTFKALLTSKQYQSADPALRKIILEAYQKASPEDRQTFVHGDDATEGLTLAPEQGTQQLVGTALKAAPAILKNNVVTGSKEGAATAIDMTGQVGGAVAGTALAGPIGGAVGETLGSVGADRLNRAIGLRDPNVVNLPTGPINMALGTNLPTQVPNQNILGPIKTSDLIAAAPPLIYRGVAGAAKYTTKPARAALTQADAKTSENLLDYTNRKTQAGVDQYNAYEAADNQAANTNASNSTVYGKDLVERATANDAEATRVQQANAKAGRVYDNALTKAQADGNTAVTAAERTAQEQTLANREAWRADGAKIIEDFKNEVQDITRRTDLSNQQRRDLIAERVQARDQRQATHNAAAKDTYTNATNGIPTQDHRPLYDASSAAAEKAPAVDVTPLNKAAKKAGLDLESPVDPGSPMAGITSRLQKWGTGGQAPLADLIEVHQDLGRTLGNLSGRQYTAGVELYKKAGAMLNEQAALHPDSYTAVTKHFEGQAAWSRNRTLEQVQEAIASGTKPAWTPGDSVMQTPQIRDRINKLSNPETNHFAGTLSPQEWAQVHAEIDKLPTEQVGRPIKTTPDKAPDFTQAEVDRDRKLIATGGIPPRVEPGIEGQTKSTWPGPKPELERPQWRGQAIQPETVKPDYSKVPSPFVEAEPKPTTPDVGKLPISPFILGKVAVSEIAPRFMGLQGSMPEVGLASSASAFLLPHWVSTALLNNEGITNKVLAHLGANGTEISRNIIARKQAVDPQTLAILTALAKHVGGKPEDTAK